MENQETETTLKVVTEYSEFEFEARCRKFLDEGYSTDFGSFRTNTILINGEHHIAYSTIFVKNESTQKT